MKYCIFDMDGTLVDSMPYWDNLNRNFLRSKGVAEEQIEPALEKTKALPMRESAQVFIELFGLSSTPEELAAEILSQMDQHYQNDIPAKPGVREYVESLAARGVKMCVVTATPENMVRPCLTRLGLLDKMEFVLSCESVGAGKDRPDVYREAAVQLGSIPPEDIVVYEDALQAVRTAKGAGFRVIAVYDESGRDVWDETVAIADGQVRDWHDLIGPIAVIEMESGAIMKAELYPDKAPATVDNFITLANRGFYDGLTFHRCISGFMIQGGCPRGDGTGDPGYTIRGEFPANGFWQNDLCHTLGVLSMARTMVPDSAGSQFFIMVDAAPYLDGKYAAFGKVIEGVEEAIRISEVPTDRDDKPKSPEVIRRIRVS